MSTTTLSYHGDEKALPAWQVTGMSVRSRQGQPRCMEVECAEMIDAEPAFHTAAVVTLRKERTLQNCGCWSGGAVLFRGLLLQCEAKAVPTGDRRTYKFEERPADGWRAAARTALSWLCRRLRL